MSTEKWPRPIGEPIVIGERIFGKAAIKQGFFNPKNKEVEDWVLFDYQKGGEAVLCSNILPITPDGQVVTVREYRKGPKRIMRQLPVGVGDKRTTTHEETALRELREETGYKAGRIIKIFPELVWIDSVYTYPYDAFLALECVPAEEGQKLDKEEIIEVDLFSFREWLSMVYNGMVVDQMSLAVTFMALPHLGVETKLPGWLQ